MNEELIIQEDLVPDADEEQEMGPRDIEAIADEDLKGSRFLLVRRSVESIQLDGAPGGAAELTCTFQPGLGSRFTWAQIILKLTDPVGVRFLDVGPHEVRENEPVRFTVDAKGKLGVKYTPVDAHLEAGEKMEFAIYHCAVQGSGAGTTLGRWDFRENPNTLSGLGLDQSLTLTLPITGTVNGEITVSTRMARSGFGGLLEGVRNLVLSPKPERHRVSFLVPGSTPNLSPPRFEFITQTK